MVAERGQLLDPVARQSMGTDGKQLGRLGDGKMRSSFLIQCLIEGDTETFALERAKEGNEHSNVVRKSAPRHMAALCETQIHSSWKTVGADGTRLTASSGERDGGIPGELFLSKG